MISWQECDPMDEEKEENTPVHSERCENDIDKKEKDPETIKQIQLSHYKDPDKDTNRLDILHKLAVFANGLFNNQAQEMVENLFSEDCMIMFYNIRETPSIKQFHHRNGLLCILNERRLQHRVVISTNVDTDKSTAFQLSFCKVVCENNDTVIDEATFEIFTVQNERIVKCILFTSLLLPCHNPESFSNPTLDQQRRAKIKSLNFALAGEPNLDKVASYLPDSVEYKIWTWNNNRYHVMGKNDFVARYLVLEDNMKIHSIVPILIHADKEAPFAVGVYIYHLEDVASGEKYIWVTTISYLFDEALNIIKVSQRGEELSREDQVSLPFEGASKEELICALRIGFTKRKLSLDPWYHGSVDYGSSYCKFGGPGCPNIGQTKFIEITQELLTKEKRDNSEVKWMKAVDIFTDFQDPTSEVCLVSYCSEVDSTYEGCEWLNGNSFVTGFMKIHFENNKVVKVIQFETYLPEPITSYFDDKEFSCEYILPLNTDH